MARHHALSDAWQKRFHSLRKAADKRLPDLKLPDSWPVAELPARRRARQCRMLETFEVLAYRSSAPSCDAIAVLPSSSPSPQPSTLVLSPAEPTPPPPKHLIHRHRERFTWESPEMYHGND